MKKQLIAVLVMALLVGAALAGQVYDRATVTVPAAGTTYWTNSTAYSAVKLVRVWQIAATASNDIALARITSDGLYTQTVGSIIGAATLNQNTATFTAGYLKYSDKLRIVSTPGTNGAVMIEFEVQQH